MAWSTGLAFTLGLSCGWNRWAERPTSCLIGGGMGARLVRDLGVSLVRVEALPSELIVPASKLGIRQGDRRSVRAMEIRRERGDLELPAIELRLEKAGKG